MGGIVRKVNGMNSERSPLANLTYYGLTGSQYNGEEPPDDTELAAPLEAETKKKKPKKNTLLTPASGGQTLSGGDMSIQRKNLLGS